MAEEKLNDQAIFETARRIDSHEARATYLQQTCGEDLAQAERVAALLRAFEENASFLESPAVDFGLAPTFTPLVGEKPGTQIGPYKLLQVIGEGGMGIVYMAEQSEPVKRKVALKLIKAGMDSRQVIARFEAERQALSMMDHVNIARVLDAGTIPIADLGLQNVDFKSEISNLKSEISNLKSEISAGRPYFVMELIHGVPITKYCDDNHLTPRQRLELFVPVCQAIQHAHQKGIIHRDIKPSNVMVTLYDGKPVPKVIDFGVAKATEQKLTERTLFTQYGTMVGTLEYMSPEQAEMSALGVDTRSDIYSLGVLLYELLTGSTPLSQKRMKEVAFAEILRLIKEEEPPKPSTRLSDSGEALASISALRHMEPARLTKLMRGELDWIVMKTLEKDRNRRYETANGFAADLMRYLNDEQVQACPPSAGYRVRKLVRRHKRAVLATALLVLVCGMIGTTWGLIRANRAEADAVSEAKQKGDALTDKEAALKDAEDQLFLALVNRARAERGSGRIGQRFEALKAIRAAARIRVTPELRTEAMAALVLPDAEIAYESEGGTGGTLNAAFDASFQRYVRLDNQGGINVCRLSDNREVVTARLPAYGQPPFHGLWMSPDGRFVAYGHSCSRDGVAGGVRVWKLDGPNPEVLLDEPEGVHGVALAFHPNGRQLAIGHAEKSISVYDLATGQRVRGLADGSTAVHLAFHPRDDRLAVACDNAVQLFDTNTGKELPALRHPAPVTHTWHLSWHPDGRRLAAGCDDRKIHLWDTQTATEVMSPWTGHTADGMSLAFNHAGDRLASADWGSQARLWDAVTGRTLLTIPVYGQFSTDDRLFGPSVIGNKISLSRLANGRELRVLRPRSAGSMDNIRSPVVHADGRTLVATSRHHLCVFDLASGEELTAARLLLADAACPVFFDPPRLHHETPEGNSGRPIDRPGGWMTGGHSGLWLWPAQQDPTRPEVMRVGPPQQLAPNPGGGFSSGAGASADGRVVAVPQGHSTLVLHRDRPDRCVVLGPQHDVRQAAVSPDGHWVVTCSFGAGGGRPQTIRVWDADTGLPVRDLAMENMTKAKFSPDGRWLMTYTAADVRQWDVNDWQEVRPFDRSEFVFSPDSRLLAIGDVFGVIRLVEAATGREVARLTGPEPTGYGPVCFTPDGTRLVATCSGETALFVWDLRLIRQQLKELGLDWEWPDFPPEGLGSSAVKPRQVEILLGDLGKSTLTREQKARQAIERCRLVLEANPDDAEACNNLAWAYLIAPEGLSDVKAALPLAEKALRLESGNAVYRNTLGVAYYRLDLYREAVDTLRPRLDKQEDWCLAFDLYFLAMSHHRLGETARARDYYDWAVRWPRTHNGRALSTEHAEELDLFRTEATELLGIDMKKD